MKDIRIPILFTVSSIVFSTISLLSWQNENLISREEIFVQADTEVTVETAIMNNHDEEEPMILSEALFGKVPFGQR